MAANGQFAMIQGADQWRRVAHEQTALDVDLGVVQLAWQMDEPSGGESDGESSGDVVAVPPAGLAFDPWCRLYRTLPEAGRLERLLW
ncbi:MAG: hypothetical protein GXP10_02285, partial [Gammaproteobacteria bacterium]|nr:hypothetical protein [Gammaproteobacteria bacterium]